MADYIRPTPRNPILGLLADAMMGGLAYMEDPRRTQQMRGLGGLLSDTGIAQTMERLSYGEPLTTGRGMTTRLRPEAEAALLTLGPEAVPIGRGAMAAVKATKGLPVGGGIVYHGSPYRFNRFDPAKIGSGEGAQAYGYGHYVAESPGVATSYKNLVQRDPNRLMVDGKVVSPDTMYGRAAEDVARIGVKATLQKIDDNIRFNEKYAPDMAAMYKDLRTKIELLEPSRVSLKEGNLYTIDLPDPAIARMLDWDKPLSQQPDIVKSINPQSLGLTYKQLENGNHAFVNSEGKIIGNLQKGGTQESFTKNWTEDVLRGTGSDLYRQLGQGMEGGPKVSSALRQAGIPGIRYLDQGSRGAGTGTSNFVVFPGEEDLLRILSVNGGLLSP